MVDKSIWDPARVTERHEGADAAKHARELLLEATGADDVQSARQMVVGRPALDDDADRASQPVVFRVPSGWKTLIENDAASQGQSVSEYLRVLVYANHKRLQAA